MVKTSFDIPGLPFTKENLEAIAGKDVLVARKTFHGDKGPIVFFEIGTVEGDFLIARGEVFLLNTCQCWWPMPTPSFSLT